MDNKIKYWVLYFIREGPSRGRDPYRAYKELNLDVTYQKYFDVIDKLVKDAFIELNSLPGDSLFILTEKGNKSLDKFLSGLSYGERRDFMKLFPHEDLKTRVESMEGLIGSSIIILAIFGLIFLHSTGIFVLPSGVILFLPYAWVLVAGVATAFLMDFLFRILFSVYNIFIDLLAQLFRRIFNFFGGLVGEKLTKYFISIFTVCIKFLHKLVIAWFEFRKFARNKEMRFWFKHVALGLAFFFFVTEGAPRIPYIENHKMSIEFIAMILVAVFGGSFASNYPRKNKKK
jgi:DNA-binding PadR family transcriptional regulator